MKRRDFLQALASTPLAAAFPAWAAPAAPNRLLVLVYLHGGNDGFNTWVPYTDRLYYKLRPTLAVPRDAVIKVTDRQGFHPSFAALAPIFERKELALIQGIALPEASQQHPRDTEMAFTASDLHEYRAEGWVTRALASRARSDSALAEAVAFGLLDIRESDPMGPFRGGLIPTVQFHHPGEFLAKRVAADCVIEANALGRASLARRPAPVAAIALKTVFPTDPFGQSVRAVVELAAADRAIPVMHVALNGLDDDKHHSVDCHWDQLKYHGDALKRLADGLAALRSGLIEIGRWDESLVITYDEFGRSPVENDKQGTHHGLGTTHFALGGRVKGGLLGVAPPVQDLHPIGGPDPVIDTRSLWTTVAQSWWQGDASGLFARRYPALDLLRA